MIHSVYLVRCDSIVMGVGWPVVLWSTMIARQVQVPSYGTLMGWLDGAVASGGVAVLRDVLTTLFLTLLVIDIVVPPMLYLLLRVADMADHRLGWGAYHPSQTDTPGDPTIQSRWLRGAVMRRVAVGGLLLLVAGFLFALVLYSIFGGAPGVFVLYSIVVVPLFVLLVIAPAGFCAYLAERANIRRRYQLLGRPGSRLRHVRSD